MTFKHLEFNTYVEKIRIIHLHGLLFRISTVHILPSQCLSPRWCAPLPLTPIVPLYRRFLSLVPVDHLDNLDFYPDPFFFTSVESVEHPSPHPAFHLHPSLAQGIHGPSYLTFRSSSWEAPLSQHRFECVRYLLTCYVLDTFKLLVTLVLQAFCKQLYVRVKLNVSTNGIDQRRGLLENQLLQSIFLSQIGVQELFHRFQRARWFKTSLIVLKLRLKYFVNCLLQIFQAHNFRLILRRGSSCTRSNVSQPLIRSWVRSPFFASIFIWIRRRAQEPGTLIGNVRWVYQFRFLLGTRYDSACLPSGAPPIPIVVTRFALLKIKTILFWARWRLDVLLLDFWIWLLKIIEWQCLWQLIITSFYWSANVLITQV